MSLAPLPEWNDMQGLVLSAYPHLAGAAYLPLHIDDPQITRAWLTSMADHVTTAFERVHRSDIQVTPRLGLTVGLNLNIAVTYSGLRKLIDVTPVDEDTFAAPFVEGIAGTLHRSRILGDIAASDPARWTWGGWRNAVDVLLMVFTKNPAHLEEVIGIALHECGMSRIVQPLVALSLELTEQKEHFGFVDGGSQPILRGTPDAERLPESMHLTELGEFVFGYVDGEQHVPRGPRLHDYETFGTNGTYLVFRQLEQDVAGFWTFVNNAVGGADPDAAERLAWKIIGRRIDATPLVPYGSRDDNEFDFADDPHGYGCPVGAHIRRAHPRGSLPGSPPGDRSNRHRLIRRARSYGRKIKDVRTPDDESRGLFFLALNSDFERQFEFINQNWLNNPGFCGLENERDPLVGEQHRPFTVPGLSARTVVPDLPRFVEARGGEYFFMPGIRALRFLGGQKP